MAPGIPLSNMSGMSGNPDFDTYRLSEDHEAIREAVRAVSEDKIAPYAAAVDEEARYPQEAHDALVASDFFAPHVPEEYGGVGADALATCIVIEEVARVCASSSLIPAVNKLGSMPLIIAANDDLKQRYLTPLAAGESTFSYGLSEREAGSDTAAMKCRAVRDGDDWVLTRPEVVDHQCRCLAVLHGARRHRPRRPARQQHHRVRRREERRGLHLRREGAQARHQGQPHPRADLRPHPHPR